MTLTVKQNSWSTSKLKLYFTQWAFPSPQCEDFKWKCNFLLWNATVSLCDTGTQEFCVAFEEDAEIHPMGNDFIKLREMSHRAYPQLFTAFKLFQMPSFKSHIKAITNLTHDLLAEWTKFILSALMPKCYTSLSTFEQTEFKQSEVIS